MSDPAGAAGAGAAAHAADDSISILAGPVTRTWRVGARHVPVQLYHNTITGDRWLSVDGIEVPGTVGSHFGPLAAQTLLSFEVEGAASGRVSIVTFGAPFARLRYAASFEGAALVEDNAAAAAAGVAGGGGASDSAGALRISVEAVDMAADEQTGHANVAWFRVRSVRESDRRETVVHRRFNNFVALAEAVRSAYQGSALIASVPELPARGFRLFEDQTSPAFLEKRRWQLQNFLYKLELLPRARQNTDFCSFTGLVDGGVREASCVFPPGAPLGVTLSAAGDFTEVSALKPNADGGASPAQAAGISVGDKVSKIAGENVIGQAYAVVIAQLKAAKRPLVVHFLGLSKSAAESAGAAAARTAAAGAASPAPASSSLRAFVGEEASTAAAGAGEGEGAGGGGGGGGSGGGLFN